MFRVAHGGVLAQEPDVGGGKCSDAAAALLPAFFVILSTVFNRPGIFFRLRTYTDAGYRPLVW